MVLILRKIPLLLFWRREYESYGIEDRVSKLKIPIILLTRWFLQMVGVGLRNNN
jgi:hypothetical protein